MPKIKIATFNINGVRSRLPSLLTWLAEGSPDIVCLQELKAVDSVFPIQAINDAGSARYGMGKALGMALRS